MLMVDDMISTGGSITEAGASACARTARRTSTSRPPTACSRRQRSSASRRPAREGGRADRHDPGRRDRAPRAPQVLSIAPAPRRRDRPRPPRAQRLRPVRAPRRGDVLDARSVRGDRRRWPPPRRAAAPRSGYPRGRRVARRRPWPKRAAVAERLPSTLRALGAPRPWNSSSSPSRAARRSGTSASRRLRPTGRVPAVLYGLKRDKPRPRRSRTRPSRRSLKSGSRARRAEARRQGAAGDPAATSSTTR